MKRKGRNIFSGWEEEQRRERRKTFQEGKYPQGEGGKYFENENTCMRE